MSARFSPFCSRLSVCARFGTYNSCVLQAPSEAASLSGSGAVAQVGGQVLRWAGKTRLAGETVQVNTLQDVLTLDYNQERLSQYSVEWQPDDRHFSRVGSPRLYDHRYQSAQLELWQPGEVEWFVISLGLANVHAKVVSWPYSPLCSLMGRKAKDLRCLRPMLSSLHVEHNFSLMVPRLQTLMSLPSLC